jgi:hypothetical protein
VPWSWPGAPEEVWEYARSVSVPFRSLIERVHPEDWPQLNAKVHAAVEKYSDGQQISFDATIILASGKK